LLLRRSEQHCDGCRAPSCEYERNLVRFNGRYKRRYLLMGLFWLLMSIVFGSHVFATTATVGTGTTCPLVIQTNGATAITIDTSQNVGLGPVTPTTSFDL